MAVRVTTEEPSGGGNRALNARAANDRIAEQAARMHFVSRVPMVCECSRPGCRKLMMISLEAYQEIRNNPDDFLTAPGHEVEGAELLKETSGYEVRRAIREETRNGGRRSA